MKNKTKKIRIFKLLISLLFLIIGFIVIYLFIVVTNSLDYLEDKYNEDFKITSISLPYYSDVSDFFDWPILFKSGDLVPLTIYCKSEEKSCTVIYQSNKYYDDYQLENIEDYLLEYFTNLTDNNNIIAVLFTDSIEHSNYTEYESLTRMLKKDNRLWTNGNIESLITTVINEFDGYISIIIYDDLNDTDRIRYESNRIKNLIIDKLDDNIIDNGTYPISIYFSNYDTDTKRVDMKNNKYGLRFDYYGFEEDQNIVYFDNAKNNNTSSKRIVIY